MPTTTTTVTSTGAGGTTTTTTTESIPEPPSTAAAPFPSMCHGRIIMGQFFRFENTADRDILNEALPSILALTNAQGGQNFCYNAASSPTEITMFFIWDSDESFSTTEQLFGQTEAVKVSTPPRATLVAGLPPLKPIPVAIRQALIDAGKLTCEATFMGELSAKTREIITRWNSVPGFNIVSCESVVAYADQSYCGLAHDATAGYGRFTHASEAACDAYLAECKATATVWMARSNVLAHAKVSATESAHLWFLRSKADAVEFLCSDLQTSYFEPLIALIPGIPKFGGVVCGNTNDPEIAAGLAPWSTWKPCPLISGSLGGSHYSFLQKASFKTPAARDAALEALKTGLDGDKQGGCYFGCPLGDSQAFFVHYAANEAGNKAIQAGFSGNPDLLGHFLDGNIAHLPHYSAGNVQNTWATELQGWGDAIPAITDTGSPLVCYREGGSFSSDAFTIIQEVQFNDAAGYQVFIDVMSSPGVLNEPTKHNFAGWKTSSNTLTFLATFATSDDWVEINKSYFPHAEKIAGAFKKSEAYISGPVSDAAQAALDAWAEAPWCEIFKVVRNGKMGM